MDVLKGIGQVTKQLATEGIEKNRKNKTGSGFMFRGIDDVYAALSHKLVAAGLSILPEVMSVERTERTASSGSKLVCTLITVRYRIYSSSDGSFVDSVVLGEAFDSGDKSASKALSIAYKYMAMQVFCIPVEGQDDPDYHSYHVVDTRELALSELRTVCSLAQKLGLDHGVTADLVQKLTDKQLSGKVEEVQKLIDAHESETTQ